MEQQRAVDFIRGVISDFTGTFTIVDPKGNKYILNRFALFNDKHDEIDIGELSAENIYSALKQIEQGFAGFFNATNPLQPIKHSSDEQHVYLHGETGLLWSTRWQAQGGLSTIHHIRAELGAHGKTDEEIQFFFEQAGREEMADQRFESCLDCTALLLADIYHQTITPTFDESATSAHGLPLVLSGGGEVGHLLQDEPVEGVE